MQSMIMVCCRRSALAALAVPGIPVLALLLALVLPIPAVLAAAGEAPAPLVDAAWLRDNAARGDIVVLDIRNRLGGGSEADYRAGHIPGAIYSDYLKDGWRAARDGVPGQLPEVVALEALIGGLGISNDNHVVIVAGGSGPLDMASATRVYWTFKVLGHDAVSILDGGHRAYVADPANPLESGRVAPKPASFIAAPRPELLAGRRDVVEAVDSGGLLIDARPPAFFEGRQQHRWAKRAGTLPGAVSAPEALFVDGGGRFATGAALDGLLQAVGLEAGSPAEGKPEIAFCNTGHWATLAWFARSELQGQENVRVYDGSMVDWTAEPARPVAPSSSLID